MRVFYSKLREETDLDKPGEEMVETAWQTRTPRKRGKRCLRWS
jgi:hypothetical protein